MSPPTGVVFVIDVDVSVKESVDLLVRWKGWSVQADWAQKHTAVSVTDFAANPLRHRLAVLFSRTSHISYHLGQTVLASA